MIKGIVSTDGDSLMTIIVILTQRLQYTLVEMFEKKPKTESAEAGTNRQMFLPCLSLVQL